MQNNGVDLLAGIRAVPAPRRDGDGDKGKNFFRKKNRKWAVQTKAYYNYLMGKQNLENHFYYEAGQLKTKVGEKKDP